MAPERGRAVGSVARAMAALDALAASERGLRVGELARRIGAGRVDSSERMTMTSMPPGAKRSRE